MNESGILRFLVTGSFYLVAIFLAIFVAPDQPFLVIGVCLGLFSIIGVAHLGRRIWILYPLSAGFSGAINLIKGGLTPLQVVSILLVFYCLYLMKADPSFRFRTGPSWIFWPLLLFTIHLLFLWIKGRDLGLNILGSSKVGGKGYMNTVIPFLGYLAAISIYRPGTIHDRFVPIYILFGYFVDGVLFFVTTLAPSLSPAIFNVYNSVNIEAFQATQVDSFREISSGFVSRFGRSGHLGYVLLAVLQVYIPYSRWISPTKILLGPPLVLLSLTLSLLSGFRNYFVRYCIVGIIGVWQSFRVYSVFLFLPIFALLAAVCALQGTVFNFPPQVQRTLLFLPGQWDPVIATSAEGSSDFRKDLKRVYFNEFFHWDSFFGDGYLYAREDLASSQEAFWNRIGYKVSEDKDDVIRGFIIRRAHHEGIIEIHHLAGHVGTIIWGFFSLIALYQCSRFVFSVPLNAMTRTANFGATLVIMNVLTFWFLFACLSEMMPDFYGFLFCFAIGQVIIGYHSKAPHSSPATRWPATAALNSA